ncbi:MAG TPA: hypothetical protein VJ779_20580 [Acetobacteraceae bacterium]|nr:hypothetical protein [Acetobacteraceae bacterium]
MDSLASPAKLSRGQQRNEKRGYAIDRKRVVMAYAAEIVVVSAMLCGSWLFAVSYGHGDINQMVMMMLAPVGYAVIELCRVPLALSVRTQRSRVVRCLAAVGVLCAAGVTVKSMSQIGEMMFRPRLYDVVHAQERLRDAQDALAAMDQRIAAADAVVAQRAGELKDAEARAISDAQLLGKLPEQKCLPTTGTDRHGHAYRSFRCAADPRIAALSLGAKTSSAARAEASDKLDAARRMRDGLDRAPAERALSVAQIAHREAVLNSQLHSFTSMVFGKAPDQVTDAEIQSFLRVFVFLPAFFVSLASTFLALTAVERIDSPMLYVPDQVAACIQPAFTRFAVEEATRAAIDAALQTMPRNPGETHAAAQHT